MRKARRISLSLLGLVTLVSGLRAATSPNILLVTVDTLRADRLSSYGYHRPTSPNIDRLLASGAQFTQTRTIEPLTAPALASMLTSLHPHQHGSTRNGLPMRSGLMSIGKLLKRRGYLTAAFVGNWTLKDRLSGLAEHFDLYQEEFDRKRWFGLLKGEATAEELTADALHWIDARRRDEARRPFLLWVHYVEPHAPYRLRKQYLERLGIARSEREIPPQDRYDTEIAYLDEAIGELTATLGEWFSAGQVLTVFLADHGESLGEHRYWGHGRNLYEEGLKIPFGIAWPGVLPAGRIEHAATLLDLAPTLMGLLGLPTPSTFRGLDWAATLRGQDLPAEDARVTFYQAHKGAVQPAEQPDKARRRGLLEVARVAGTKKEVVHVPSGKRSVFDLAEDPAEKNAEEGGAPSEELQQWLAEVRRGLEAADELPAVELSQEELDKLRALGYID